MPHDLSLAGRRVDRGTPDKCVCSVPPQIQPGKRRTFWTASLAGRALPDRSWRCISLLFLRVIERALNIEFPDALREHRIVCYFKDAWVLKEIKEAPLLDQVDDFRVAS